MVKLICDTNEIYYVTVYLMNEDFSEVENCICIGDIEDIKNSFRKKYKKKSNKYGFEIIRVNCNDNDAVYWEEDI